MRHKIVIWSLPLIITKDVKTAQWAFNDKIQVMLLMVLIR